ncbi:hypothetical protein TeGR_g13102 [Tetraparma gracilis]|uniref:Uncharacterized protein n=1 Tax=Tetraparma gracilis TaxID=2962635 RepID=A0ABQ6MN76_9STRA|nr:hypothetical protein TeGR_g13102 [Tetraparma gracilis]
MGRPPNLANWKVVTALSVRVCQAHCGSRIEAGSVAVYASHKQTCCHPRCSGPRVARALLGAGLRAEDAVLTTEQCAAFKADLEAALESGSRR